MPRSIWAFVGVFALPALASAQPGDLAQSTGPRQTADSGGSELAFPVGVLGSYGLEEAYGIGVGLRGGVRRTPFYVGLSFVNHFGEREENVLYAGPEVGLSARVPLVVAFVTSSAGVLRANSGGEDQTEIFIGPGASLVSAPSSPLAPGFVGVDARYIWVPGTDGGNSSVFSLWLGMEFGGPSPQRARSL